MRLKGFIAAWLLMAGANAWAEAPEAAMGRQVLVQGGYFIAKVPVGSTVKLDGVAVSVGPEGSIVAGFGRTAPAEMVLEICDVANECVRKTLAVKPRVFKTQNVKGIPPKTVDPSPAEEKRIAGDNWATKVAREKAIVAAGEQVAYVKRFVLPVDGPTSGVYGSRRSYNGQERSWHKGHDLAAKTGTPVMAPADGVVRLARDTFMSGNLIMLDHGGGLTTVYAHLDRMLVKAGDKVRAGKVIGKVGTTGRSSGPHLHWGMYWQDVPIDPILWIEK